MHVFRDTQHLRLTTALINPCCTHKTILGLNIYLLHKVYLLLSTKKKLISKILKGPRIKALLSLFCFRRWDAQITAPLPLCRRVNQDIMRCARRSSSFSSNFSIPLSFLPSHWYRSLGQLSWLKHRAVQSGTGPCLASGVTGSPVYYSWTRWVRDEPQCRKLAWEMCLLMYIKRTCEKPSPC